jgi:hypothetical protein
VYALRGKVRYFGTKVLKFQVLKSDLWLGYRSGILSRKEGLGIFVSQYSRPTLTDFISILALFYSVRQKFCFGHFFVFALI